MTKEVSEELVNVSEHPIAWEKVTVFGAMRVIPWAFFITGTRAYSVN